MRCNPLPWQYHSIQYVRHHNYYSCFSENFWTFHPTICAIKATLGMLQILPWKRNGYGSLWKVANAEAQILLQQISHLMPSQDKHNNVLRKYCISRPIRHTFFPEKCDLNSTCVLCAEGKIISKLIIPVHLLHNIFIVR